MIACSSLLRGQALEYDVIIVGAGPAGSTAARYCGKEGLKTLLVEKERFPRYKPCGGFISPRVLGQLDFPIEGIIDSTVCEVRFTFKSKDPFSIASRDPIGYLVKRDSFDHLLCRKAQEAGAEFYEGRRVVGFQQDSEGVDISMMEGEPLRCRYLVGADGARSIVRNSLFPGVTPKAGIAMAGEGCLAPGFQRRSVSVRLDLGAVPSGYGWVFPKGKFASIGIGALRPSKETKLRNRFEHFVESMNKTMGVRMKKACFHPLPTFYGDDLPRAKGRVLLVGDAANLADPLTGEGIYYAVRSGKMAAEAIVAAIKHEPGKIKPYLGSLKRLLMRDLGVALKLANAIYRVPRLAYTVLKSSRNLGFLYVHLLCGKALYSDFSREMVGGIKGRLEEVGPALGEISSAVEQEGLLTLYR
jgi:geranylgeranyl reductase family protein